MIFKKDFIRYIDYEDLFENFIVSGVVAILVVRFYLTLAHFPQLGKGGLHIAHMLWGGLLMTLSMLILFTFLTKASRYLASVLGGIGFGIFIDEIGKFVTSDNNYFFQPTFLLIYLIFIFIYVLMKTFGKMQQITSEEYVINSIDLMKEAVINDLDEREKEIAIQYLKKSNIHTSLTQTLEKMYRQSHALPNAGLSLPRRTAQYAQTKYVQFIQRRWFKRVLFGFFVIQSLLSVLAAVLYMAGVDVALLDFDGIQKTAWSELYNFLHVGSSGIAGVAVLAGVAFFSRSRLRAYQFFKYSTLISIFLVQIFAFYLNPLGAFTNLLWSLGILVAINFMIEQEKLKRGVQSVLPKNNNL